MNRRVFSATEFKTHCLALLDEVAAHRQAIVVTKRGRAVAALGPVQSEDWRSPEGAWKGKVTVAGDIVNTGMSELWDAAGEE